MRSAIVLMTLLVSANGFAQTPAQWQLGPPILAVGSETPGPTQFSKILTVLLRADSGIVVANGDSKELRYFNSSGQFVSASGRNGSGPGEFRELSRVFRMAGDSIGVYDAFARRLNVLSPLGVFARSLSLEPPPGTTGAPSPAGGFADGSFASFTARPPIPGPGQERGALHRLTATWYRHDAGGKFIAVLGQSPAGEHFLEMVDGMVVNWAPPFQRLLRYAVVGDRIFAGDGLEPTLTILRSDPVGSQSLRVTTRNLALTPDDVAKYKQEQLDRAPTPHHRTQLETSFSKTPTPTSMAAFEALRADAQGNVWLREYPRPGVALVRWQVISASGTLIATLDVPAAFTITDVGADRVAGIWRDENDVETVRLYRIRR